MERRKTYTYLVSTLLILIMTALFAANIFTGYFSFLDPGLSALMAFGFFICAIQELSNYFRARREEKEEGKKQ